MKANIALVGNPNSGKTTLFNALTGSNQYVGNWPGVTVEKKTGLLKKDKEINIVDLPGIYSMSPYTLEEVVARDYLLQEKPDAIVNIIDGTNLERSLYLTTQLLELSVPVIIAINMMDLVSKNEDVIKVKDLAARLGCTVDEISARKNEGVDSLVGKVKKMVMSNLDTEPKHRFQGVVEHAIAHIEEAMNGKVDKKEQRWYAIKLFERDEKVLNELTLDKDSKEHIEREIASAEKELDDDSESIITNERYDYITTLLEGIYKKKNNSEMTISDKIDRVVTSRWLGLPIFAVIIFLVYYISVSTLGGILTDFTNDTLIGEWIMEPIRGLMEGTAPDWLTGLVVDGIIGGVGAVLGFVPQILVLFILLAILEECGYMARIAFVLDRIFRRFGLSGKSFIPMLIGTGCSIPGIMASRTIENERDRRMTIITTSFVPCGAKLPIIALLASALFGGASWVAPSAYFLGIGAVIVSGIMLKKTARFQGEPAPFVMELPAYHMPKVGAVLRSMWERGWSFIKKAGTVIAAATVVIWFISSYSWGLQPVENYDGSILQSIGSGLAVIFKPLGFGDDKASVATILGLVAKETVVATFGILMGIGEVAEDDPTLLQSLQVAYTPIAGYSFMIFNLLCAPCFAAIGAIKREMNNVKWTWFAILYQTIFAYSIALIFYQFAMLFAGTPNVLGLIVAGIVAILIIYQLFRPYKEETKRNFDKQNKLVKEYS
jgi:ferrous iron transport protein B